MKVIKIDFENKSFTTDDGIEYPFVFDVNPSITIEEFQSLIDKCEICVKDLLDNG
jgi:FKBP-type peptidyl-prolyl cis-trans isomerase (trigger factor)